MNHEQQIPHIDQPGDAEPTPPLTVVPQSKSVMPRRYVVHKHSQLCKSCGTLHEWTQLYTHSDMASRTGAGKLVVHLVPVKDIEYNLPIECIVMERKTVALCHECAATASLSHLPDPTNTDEWKRIYAVAPAPTQTPYSFGSGRPATPKKPPKTIDDLLF